MIFTDYWKVLVLNFSEMGNTVFFEPKSWWKDDIYWLLKSSCFEFSGDGNTVFFQPKSWWKDNIYWLLKSSCFELFGDGKYGLFLSQKVDGKIIFTWSFWALRDIARLANHGFLCSINSTKDSTFLKAAGMEFYIKGPKYLTEFWLK